MRTGFNAQIIKDSLFRNGVRVTTALLSFPRNILAEFNTHRMFTRNAGSSRAIPSVLIFESVMENPYIPVFTRNAKGMQGWEYLTPEEQATAEEKWLFARNHCAIAHKALTEKDGLNVHKQFANRLLENWMWATVVVTATDWENMFAQRTHEMAQPDFQKVANLLKAEYDKSIPKERWVYDSSDPFKWHLPFVNCSDTDREQIARLDYLTVRDYLEEKLGADVKYSRERYGKDFYSDISVGRLAKISYNNLETGKIDVLNDIRLAVQLSNSYPGHWSPFEHVCREATPDEMTYSIDQLTYNAYSHSITPKKGEIGYCANFKGAYQYRKEFPNENIV